MNNNYYDVIIITPGFSMEADYVNSLLKTIEQLNLMNISWKFVNGKSSIIHDARYRCLFGNDHFPGSRKLILDGINYQKVFWIDSDMVWQPEDFLKLFYSDKQIISGCAIVGNNYHVAIYHKINSGMLGKGAVVSIPQVPHQVEATGMAFMAVDKCVLESMPNNFFDSVTLESPDEDGNMIPWVCNSEDISFCIRARRAGFSVWFDPTVRVGHIKKQLLIL